MKVKDIMTQRVIRVGPEATVEVAARTLSQYNIGMLPVCGGDGKLLGLVTDRDLVTRCMAAGRDPGKTAVREVMTGRVVSVSPEVSLDAAAELMGNQQIRRLPVTEKGKLCGILSLGDMAKGEVYGGLVSSTLGDISKPLSGRFSW